jgi:predicted Zn-ribbon and HTH transcriptional regulator
MIEKINVKQLRFTCDKCGYVWGKRPGADQTKIPKQCPRCKTYKWNDGKK